MGTSLDIIQDEEKRNKVKFFAFIIPEFARAYKMNKKSISIPKNIWWS